MNTSFAGNQVGSFVTLDVAGSYPLGYLAQLGPYYNYSQDGMLAQYRYTATQVDITTGQDAAYGRENISNQTSGIILPNSLDTVNAATPYLNAASQVNYANQNISSAANFSLTNADIITKSCQDASYSGYLTIEASQIILDRISTSAVVIQLGNEPPEVSPVDYTTLATISTIVSGIDAASLSTITLASQNRQSYFNNTNTLLSNAYTKSNILYTNLNLAAAFAALVKSSAKALADPMSKIAGKESLVTQYVPSIPLNNAITILNRSISSLNAFSEAISQNINTSAAINSNVSTSISFANSLDMAARVQDNSMYLSGAVSNLTVNTISTLQGNGGIIAIPSIYPNNPRAVASNVVSAYSDQTRVALDADISAENARFVSNALVSLKNIYSDAPVLFHTIPTVVTQSISILNSILDSVNKVTSNSSAHSAVKITKRSYNTIHGILSRCESDEVVALNEASDAKSVLDLIIRAQSIWLTAVDLPSTQLAHWAINAAKGRAEEVSAQLRDRAYSLNRTAHTLVTPANIAVQTYSANSLGALNNNVISRMNRLSKNVPLDPPPAYKSYQADSQVKTFVPPHSKLDELLYKNKLYPLRLDSLTTILATKVKVAEDVQEIKDASAFSYRQQ
jgi:hypothetical protein